MRQDDKINAARLELATLLKQQKSLELEIQKCKKNIQAIECKLNNDLKLHNKFIELGNTSTALEREIKTLNSSIFGESDFDKRNEMAADVYKKRKQALDVRNQMNDIQREYRKIKIPTQLIEQKNHFLKEMNRLNVENSDIQNKITNKQQEIDHLEESNQATLPGGENFWAANKAATNKPPTAGPSF